LLGSCRWVAHPSPLRVRTLSQQGHQPAEPASFPVSKFVYSCLAFAGECPTRRCYVRGLHASIVPRFCPLTFVAPTIVSAKTPIPKSPKPKIPPPQPTPNRFVAPLLVAEKHTQPPSQHNEQSLTIRESSFR
jgi:hypothetical protein